ncbi:MAG: hypothetical protein JSU66_17675 [Deltaproteobacteria bacterium]|nr:MAG: hypothetical protein JSU66_17675 [Deltaproteobacteria bacterium]
MLALLASPAPAALAPADQQTLTASLIAASERDAVPACGRAHAILRRERYDSADFTGFFAAFFARQPLTEPLSACLARPALHAPSERTREALQEALAALLVGEIASILDSHLSDGRGSALGSDPATFEHLRASMGLLGTIAFEGEHLSRASRAAHYDRLKAVIEAHPDVLEKHVTLDARRQPKLAALRAHLYKNLFDLRVPIDAADFVAAAGFRGRYAALVRDHGLIVLDNNGFDARQLEAIDAVLRIIPPGLHAVRHISQHELLGNTVGGKPVVRFRGSPGLNVFGTPVDGAAVNPFPTDSEPVVVPRFCAVLQHELNHAVNAHAVRGDRALSRRMDRIIEQAGGSDPRQFLRSTLPEGFFATHRQEFFASIANQYFSDSVETLLLALRRFEAGWREPLNQFLFFADVYSGGSDTTLFVAQDPDCNYSVHTVPIGRDANGRIDRITWQGVELQFKLDAAGNVIR